MPKRLRIAVLHFLRAIGIFSVARRLTDRSVRILCYHGISIDDQHELDPLLFMRPEVFERRLELLVKNRWRVISLEEAIEVLEKDAVEDAPVVVTIDDGWKSTATHAVPALARASMPATVYVTTKYIEQPADVFDVACRYLLRRTTREEVELTAGLAGLDGRYALGKLRAVVARHWIESAKRELDEDGRQVLLRHIAEALGVDIGEALGDGRCRLMTPRDVSELGRWGVDVQLHTHSHQLPADSLEAMRPEIERNRELLERWKGAACQHFCYPSGEYRDWHPTWLAAAGIRSATTCDPGLNDATSDRFLLRRILDRDDWSDIEFEAALSGLYQLTSWFRGLFTASEAMPRHVTPI